MQLREQLLKTGEVQRQLMRLQNELAGERRGRANTNAPSIYSSITPTKSSCRSQNKLLACTSIV